LVKRFSWEKGGKGGKKPSNEKARTFAGGSNCAK